VNIRDKRGHTPLYVALHSVIPNNRTGDLIRAKGGKL
jgi:hypothetical protein